VLCRLHAKNLAASIEKYEFSIDSVEFFMYIISLDGIGMSKEKVEAIRSSESLKTQNNIRAFMGFLNFYQIFIDNFSKIVKPLTNLTKAEFKGKYFQ
jgi:hypothetical protein